jgi:hypothetical protein
MPLPDESQFSGWHKASASNRTGGNCVEVGYAPGRVAVRDTKSPGQPALIFTALKWNHFVDRVHAGEYPDV